MAMRVLHIIHSLDRRSGGPAHAIREMVQAQLDAGMEPSIVATNAQSVAPWAPDQQFRESVKSEPLFQRVPVEMATAYGKKRPWSRYSWSPEASRVLENQVKGDSKPDVVHIHGVFSHITQKASQFARRHAIPYIIRPAGALDVDCIERGSSGLKRLFIRTMLTKAIQHAAFIHVTSQKEEESIRAQFPGANVEVLPHGTTLTDPTTGRFRSQHPGLEGRDYALCLSRVHPIKRIDRAIEAFHSVANDYSDLQLVIAGNDAGAMGELKNLVGKLQLDERCHFTGFVEGADKARAYADARVLMHTSDHENFGLSVVEAMAYGCPVVTTDGVASGVYVDRSQAGHVVPPQVPEIADALRKLLDEPRAEAGDRGAAFVQQNLTWPSIIERLADLYSIAIRTQ